ncbi:PTS sugar transporter subunit IIA [Ideonella paludis]|uniref:PTS fructose transporter subunit IIA n=1 Tax=Ideonella paludis TaxID=1233411 RepID=A0ABS5DZQ9_9BURK|nr:PTS fructose transporter subunit IIA [Ideonella paludis]MBQ0936648.1 PTS fructose transporter subunit IIA [Ideonella paludis]
MTTLLIMAHAPLASALRDVAAHVWPEAAREVLVLDVRPEWDGEAAEAAAQALIAQSAPGDVLILTDVFGATPCNVAQRLADGRSVRVVAGVNVAMLWRTLSYAQEPLDALVARAVAGGAQGVLQLAPQAPQIQTQRPPRHDQEHPDHQQ